MMNQYGMSVPRELVLISKQLLYMERYTRALAPDWSIATDLFLVKNIFPEAVAAKAEELGVVFPDESQPGFLPGYLPDPPGPALRPDGCSPDG